MQICHLQSLVLFMYSSFFNTLKVSSVCVLSASVCVCVLATVESLFCMAAGPAALIFNY